MEGKELVKFLNRISGRKDVYGYDTKSNKVIVVERDNLNNTTIMSTEKAFNELKEKTYSMMAVIQDIFNAMVEDKPASNGGDSK